MTTILIHTEDGIEKHNVDNVVEFLMIRFKKWSLGITVYRKEIKPENKIHLDNISSIKEFATFKYETLHVVVSPEGLGLIGVLFLVATGAAVLLGKKSNKEKATRKEPTAGSPNNGLSARENTERIGERVPDIYGKVRSVPDLITPPYTVYEGNTEVEYSLSVIGRGEYTVEDVRDGETLISQISNAAVQVFAPGNFPATPQLTIGSAIAETIVAVKKSNKVNGQILLAPNANHVSSGSRFKFFPTGLIEVDNSVNPDEQPDIEFDAFFSVGDVFVITGAWNVNGTYTITAVTSDSVTLSNPALVNAYWSSLPALGVFNTSVVHFTTTTDRSIGPMILENSVSAYCNFVAEEGLFKDNNEQQIGISVVIQITSRAVDASDVPFGPTYVQNVTLKGSSQSRGRVAVTLKAELYYENKRFQISAKRITNKDFAFAGQVSDEITFESLYGVHPIATGSFSELTVVKSRTFANPNSLALKSRKLNMLVTRKIPLRISGTTFGAPTATSSFADIMVSIIKDPKIGNRTNAEIDFDSIYAAKSAVDAYFGTTKASEFNYTFDDSNLSFEEILSMVAETVHCSVYRQGNVIKVFFEKEVSQSRLLFNHRNKLPGSEKRTFNFGKFDDRDGVEVSYTDTKDGSQMTYYIPSDQSAVNPEVVDIAGLTNRIQAYFHAYRAWNKIRYKNTVLEFEATQEANLLIRGERVLVADNTRPKTWDGEVINKVGLLLTLSEEFIPEVGHTYSIFLQLADATIQAIAITAGTYTNEVVLAYEPSVPLAIGQQLYASCTYEIVDNSSDWKRAFIVESKDPQSSFNSVITAYNYDDRYYQNDTDYIDEVINLEAYAI